jgi:hypothetical protein
VRLPLGPGAEAHRAQEGGDATGSIVLAASVGANCKKIVMNRNENYMLDNNRNCSYDIFVANIAAVMPLRGRKAKRASAA